MSNAGTVHSGHVRVTVGLCAVAVGMFVAWKTVGFYPTINHCPHSEKFVCPSSNLLNVIPAAVATLVSAAILFPVLYAEQRYFESHE